MDDVSYRGDVYERVLYVGTPEGDLRALVAEDQTQPSANGGDELWRYTLRGDIEKDLVIYGTPAVARDTIFFASYGGFLYSLSLDGEEQWDTRIGDGHHVVGGVTVADDVVLVGSNDGAVYAYEYDFENHAAGLRWLFKTDGEVWSTPTVHDGVAYFGSLDHHVYAVDRGKRRPDMEVPNGRRRGRRPGRGRRQSAGRLLRQHLLRHRRVDRQAGLEVRGRGQVVLGPGGRHG